MALTNQDLKKIEHISEKVAEKVAVKHTEALARVVKDGFDEMDEKFHTELGDLKRVLQADIRELKDGQEKIKMTLFDLAYKYEIRRLEDRVARLEKAIGLTK